MKIDYSLCKMGEYIRGKCIPTFAGPPEYKEGYWTTSLIFKSKKQAVACARSFWGYLKPRYKNAKVKFESNLSKFFPECGLRIEYTGDWGRKRRGWISVMPEKVLVDDEHNYTWSETWEVTGPRLDRDDMHDFLLSVLS